MRDRDVIQASGMKAEYLILEVLLDIRDMLNKPQSSHLLLTKPVNKGVKQIGRPKKIK